MIGHLDVLKKVVFSSARVVLPEYRITHFAIILRKSGLLPPDLEVNKKSR